MTGRVNAGEAQLSAPGWETYQDRQKDMTK